MMDVSSVVASLLITVPPTVRTISQILRLTKLSPRRMPTVQNAPVEKVWRRSLLLA
jgi:hypothetical protein